MLIALALAAALASGVDAIARTVLDEAPAAGMTVGIARNGKPVLVKGYGFANLELHVPARGDTVYRIGSMTKQFTAAAVMQLVEQGKLRLDEDLAEAYPDFPTQGRHVTIAELLSHTSGIPNYTSLPKFRPRAREDFAPRDLLQLVAGEPFRFEPGTRWEYSNTNYHLLGLILERATGLTYAEALEKNVFPRAGLKHTRYCDSAPLIAGRAAGYDTRGSELRNAEFLSMTIPFAAGGLCSTVPDLLRWTDALAAGQVVSKESYARMTTPEGAAKEYGFGLGLQELDGRRAIAHGGGVNGFSSMGMRFPEDGGLVVVVLTNTSGDAADTAAERIARAALGLAEPVAKDLPVEAPGQLAGVYRTQAGQRVIVAARGDKLVLQSEKDPEDVTPLLHQGGGDFVIKGSTRHATFRDGKLCFGDGRRCFFELARETKVAE